ncbi:DUF4349 domain-containing protein [Novosphingobium sp. P6W]|uniref:DUF4349 domain-containing protein n=1 Tax=Novosphingobium sp. P6W TaxID=1609758 RepID=UPI0005C2BD6D|nr:DUF4349 domain-containing protein [Novosphingobium sp. P6W]AXB76844.1 DUF4349 domain-containing protein [Novosphingobium sp. P6W]KIS33308.1 hypothetical protein TQ38_07770 [Novosphingobium sp. P6W]
MHRSKISAGLLALALAGCGSAPAPDAAGPETTVDIREEAPATVKAQSAGEAKQGEAKPGEAIAVSAANGPRIAYVYEYGYRLAAERIPEVQRSQADLCEKQGPQVCRILDMKQNGSEGRYAAGSLALAVAAPRARAFGAQLGKLAGNAGGTQVSSAISGEDLSKQIVDTEARLRARSVLRDRLMEVLATRKGTVAELVEAERGVAQVNEEIDEARSWLTEMQGRVNFSRVNLSYEAGSPSEGGFLSPIRSAMGNVSTVLGTIFAVVIMLLAVAVPLGLIGFAIRWAILSWRKRLGAKD